MVPYVYIGLHSVELNQLSRPLSTCNDTAPDILYKEGVRIRVNLRFFFYDCLKHCKLCSLTSISVMVSWVSFTSELPGEELVRFLYKQVSPTNSGLQ
jgi:hypothetical protein